MIRLLPSSRSFRARLIPFTFVLSAILATAVTRLRAELIPPTPSDHNVTKAVLRLMKMDHLTRHPLDDEIAKRLVKGFIKTLDPAKVYFYQSDVDSFMAEEAGLDELLYKGDTMFSYHVFTTLLERIDERVKTIDELLAMDHDFTVDEELIVDPEVAEYPKNAEEARDSWRKRIKYDLLVLKADAAKTASAAEADKNAPAADEKPKKPPEDPVKRLARRYHSFAKRMHQTDHNELLEMYLTSLTTAYDPHSTYMAPNSYENFEIQMRLNLDGIGASLQFDDGYTVVKQIIPGGAADKDGRLKPEDRIVGVGQGEDGPVVDTVDMKLTDVVDMIRGHRGTTVRLEVMPGGQGEPTTYAIVRAKIELTDSEARGEVVEQERDGRTYRVGVIDLPSFYMDMEANRRGVRDFKSTTRDVERLLRGFREKRVDAVILDLQRNGGGSLSEAISMTGLFIDTGPVVQVKDKADRVAQYDDQSEGLAWDGPLVVLTSKLSASASEIFAGAIQDYRRGIIVGDKSTHGKGTVQSLYDVGEKLFGLENSPKLGALKITMQQFYRPNGDSTQNRGVLADVPWPSLTNELKGISESDLDYALAFDRVNPADHEDFDMVDKAIVERLNRQSAERRKDSKDFKRVERNLERYQQQKNRKTVPLNEAKFLAERAELNADREEEKELEKSMNTKKIVFDRSDFYNREALDITLDYLQLGNLAQAN
ncbi:MAG TPA: carboxy terminal-processing peptidase [Pirellulales bacterium]|nr:carboxy terminal-processing peptidase [Pirellulales bacterium]